MKKNLSRRNFLFGAGAAALSMAAPASARKKENPAPSSLSRKRTLRIAHLTDIHVQPEQGAPQGMARALRHAQSLAIKPDVIFNGGDSIMDAFGADKARTKTQWQIWQSVLRDECSLPVEHCIGNHDVWGWGLKEGADPDQLYGKQWALEEFGLASRYRSFERGGWHFIVLDSTHPAPGGYIGKLDEAQFEWLEEDLQKTPGATPVCVLSHIPIACFCCFFDGENETEKTGDWRVPGAWMHIDARRIKDLFYRHANVKLCLSGHIHLQDRVEYLGVKYLCNGAVSGNWWEGRYQEFPPAYVIVDLFDDGTVESEFVPY